MAEEMIVQCPSCQARYQVGSDQVGQTLTCAQCGRPFTVGMQAGGPPPMAGYAGPATGADGMLPPMNGMAIASLVCSLLFCIVPVISSLLGLVLGIVALSQTSGGRSRGRGMAIAGTTVSGVGLLLIFPLMLSILLPSLNKARETANRVKCASNMHQIGLGILLYQQDNAQQYPPDLTTLAKNEQLGMDVFVCPSSNDTPAASPAQLASGGHLSYVYLKPPVNHPDSTTPVLYEHDADHNKDGMNILFGDGHAEWERLAQAQPLIDAAKAAGSVEVTQ